ncbi:MAG TPA: phosphotransferase [Nocardioidaceae bacterium]|nr:phosphotransferase [Nocardioidaceae bacterium]
MAVYRGDQTYLRIGPGLAAELDLHKTMLSFDFPVAGILDEGVHERFAYFIEESLGPQTLGDRFEEQLDAGGGIVDEGFADFMSIVERQIRAQLSMPTRPVSADEFDHVTGAHQTAKRLPDLAPRILDAFHAALARLDDFPGTLVHGDLHAFNMCAGGVIDLEDSGWGIAGYDVLTAAYVSALGDLGDRPWFTTQQIESYVAMIDRVFANHGIAPPSSRLDDFLLCRTIALCSQQHPNAEVSRCRDDTLRTMLDRFEAGRPLLPLSDR